MGPGVRPHPFGVALALTLVFASAVAAQPKSIRVGIPLPLSGAGALLGQPTAKGAEMLAREVNERGGILGRKLELVVRDSRGTAEEAARIARDLIVKEGVEFLLGGLRGPEVAAIAAVAREQKTVYLAPLSKATAAVEPAKLNAYTFRSAPTSQAEGRAAAVEMAKLPVSRLFTISVDDDYGQTVTRAFLDALKRLRPEVQLVGQGWARSSDHDYPPFIATALAARPDGFFAALWGGQFTAFVRQAKPYGFFDKVRAVIAGDAGAPEVAMAIRDELPVGIVTNATDLFYAHPSPEHQPYIERAKVFFGQDYPPSSATSGYVAMQFLAEAIQKAGGTEAEKVIRALEGLSISSPLGKMTMRAKDHQATRGQFWGVTARVAEYNFPILSPVHYAVPDDATD